jgi:hypothetical protein
MMTELNIPCSLPQQSIGQAIKRHRKENRRKRAAFNRDCLQSERGIKAIF